MAGDNVVDFHLNYTVECLRVHICPLFLKLISITCFHSANIDLHGNTVNKELEVRYLVLMCQKA